MGVFSGGLQLGPERRRWWLRSLPPKVWPVSVGIVHRGGGRVGIGGIPSRRKMPAEAVLAAAMPLGSGGGDRGSGCSHACCRSSGCDFGGGTIAETATEVD